jgi:hypothetical protein
MDESPRTRTELDDSVARTRAALIVIATVLITLLLIVGALFLLRNELSSNFGGNPGSSVSNAPGS